MHRILDALHAAATWIERYALVLALVGLTGLAVLGVKVQNESSANHRLSLRVQGDEQLIASAQHQLQVQQTQAAMSRREATRIACVEANEHHLALAHGLGVLLAKSPPKTAAERARQAEGLPIFINAIAPAYNCATRVRELNSPHPKTAGKVKVRLTHHRASKR